MNRTRAQLPAVKNKHLRSLQILNETGYDTRAIRSLLIRALRSQGMQVKGVVRIVYSGGSSGHHGCAAIGDGQYSPGLNMSLSLPRETNRLDFVKFALVVRHEVMHWRGVRHVDMTADQLYCQGTLPMWAEDIVLVHRDKPVESANDRREVKLEHARRMLARAETRLRRAETIVKRWKHRVQAAERAITKASEVTGMKEVPMAADRGGET